MNLRTYPALQKAACQQKVLKIVKEKGEVTPDDLITLASEDMTFKLAKDTTWFLMDRGKIALEGDKIKFVVESPKDFVIDSIDQVRQNGDGTVTIYNSDGSNSIIMQNQEWQDFLYKQIEG